MSIATFEPFGVGVVDHKKSEVENGTNIIAKPDLENLLDFKNFIRDIAFLRG